MNQFGVEYGDKPPVKVAVRILQQFQYQYKDYLSCAVIVCGWIIWRAHVYIRLVWGALLLKEFLL